MTRKVNLRAARNGERHHGADDCGQIPSPGARQDQLVGIVDRRRGEVSAHEWCAIEALRDIQTA
jgi:hypothetical protein